MLKQMAWKGQEQVSIGIFAKYSGLAWPGGEVVRTVRTVVSWQDHTSIKANFVLEKFGNY